MKPSSILALGFVLAWAGAAAAAPFESPQAATADSEIADEVLKRIDSDATIRYEKITVNFTNGVATLSGYVDSEAARRAAAEDAAEVAGVKTVVNNLLTGAEVAQPAPVAPAANLSAQPSPALQNTPPPAPQPITLPVGTPLDVRLFDQVSSQTARVGDPFRGSVAFPVSIGGAVVVPTTALIRGRVVKVIPAKSFGRAAVLTLQLTELAINGASYPIETGSWSRAGRGDLGAAAAEIGGGTASGAAVGAAAGGGKGAGIGAGVGAAAGIIIAGLTKGEPIIITSEAVISFTTLRPLTLGETPASNSLPAPSPPDGNRNSR